MIPLLRPLEISVKTNTPQFEKDYKEWSIQQEENERVGIPIDRDSEPDVENYIKYVPMTIYSDIERISLNIDEPKTSYITTEGIMYITNMLYGDLKKLVEDHLDQSAYKNVSEI